MFEQVWTSLNEFAPIWTSLIQLLESDVLGVLPVALPAHVEAVLSDESVAIGAGPASSGSLSVLSGSWVPDVVKAHLVGVVEPVGVEVKVLRSSSVRDLAEKAKVQLGLF